MASAQGAKRYPSAATQLLSRIIDEGPEAFREVLEWGITLEDMQTTEEKAHFLFIKGFYTDATTQGSIPGRILAKQAFETWVFVHDPHMTVAALCEMARRDTILIRSREMVTQFIEDVSTDHTAALLELEKQQKKLAELNQQTKDVSFREAIHATVLDYELLAEGSALSKISWPWPSLQEATGGVQEDEYAIFYGRPKVGKSYYMTKLTAHFHALGLTTLVYTKEMPWKQYFRRTLAFELQMVYEELKNGKLSPDQLAKLHEASAMAFEPGYHDNLILLNGHDMKPGADTVEWLESKIERYKPDVVLVDGQYLMAGDSANEYERIRDNSRKVRQLILRKKIPIISSVQSNRSGEKEGASTTETAGSDALGQDATLLLKCIKTRKGVGGFITAAARDVVFHGLLCNFKPCIDFTEIRGLTEEEAEQIGGPKKKGKPSFVDTLLDSASDSSGPVTGKNPSNVMPFPSKAKPDDIAQIEALVANMTQYH